MGQSTERFEMLLPVPDTVVEGMEPAPRLSTLRGKTIGFIDNGWRSLGFTLDVFEALLYERGEVRDIVRKKTPAGVPLKKEEFEDLAAQTDAVVTGLGN